MPWAEVPEDPERAARREAVSQKVCDLLTEHADLFGPQHTGEDTEDCEFIGPMICTGFALGMQWTDLGAHDTPDHRADVDWVLCTRHGLTRSHARGLGLDIVDHYS